MVHHEMHTSFAEMHLFQANDGQLFLRSRPRPWLMLRALRKNQVSFSLTLLLPTPVSTTLGSSLCSRKRSCLRSIYSDSTTHVKFAGAARGQIPYGQRCETGLSSEWLPLCDGLWPIFRWLQEVVILRNPDILEFLQPTQCAYADDLAVAASSFRDLLTALAPAFRSVDHIAGLNLNQYGTEERESLVVLVIREW